MTMNLKSNIAESTRVGGVLSELVDSGSNLLVNCDENKYANAKYDDVRELIEKWGFGSMYKHFVDNDLSIEKLKVMTEADLSDLFRGYKLGRKIVFRGKMMEWRVENKISVPRTCHCYASQINAEINAKVAAWLEKNKQIQSSSSTSRMSSSSSTPEDATKFDSDSDFDDEDDEI